MNQASAEVAAAEEAEGANVVATAAVIVAVIAMTVPGVKTSPRVLQRLSKLRL